MYTTFPKKNQSFQAFWFMLNFFFLTKKVICSDGSVFLYDKLCICTGGKPKLIAENNQYVLGIRDTESVVQFQSRLKNARQVVVVGNGGIATEIVYEIRNCKIMWIIKDKHISHHFFDAHSAKFFEKKLKEKHKPQPENEIKENPEDEIVCKRIKYSISSKKNSLNLLNHINSVIVDVFCSKGLKQNPLERDPNRMRRFMEALWVPIGRSICQLKEQAT
jgi:hypothetical protein